MYKILLVEDDERLLEAMADYMKARGMEVFCATDGAKAITMLDGKDFDIILLDVMMPKVNGFTVCKSVRERSKVPIMTVC